MNNENFGSKIWNKLSSFSKIPEYNVLLLGEAGVGKSTTINSWANYMRYKTFEEAKYGKLEQMIPAKFTLPDPVTKEAIEIKCGLDDDDCDINESFNDEGTSVTQMPSAYTFKLKNKIMRIFDTPGIGDINADRENIDKIYSFLNNYEELHAIVIMVKANQTQGTERFCYCISELLNLLHKDSIKNLIFCFTFSPETNFRPGQGYKSVKEFFHKELPEVDFKLKPGENCFFINNDSFHFLSAVIREFSFNMKQEQSYGLNWKKSAEESHKLWNRIISQERKPHNLTDTKSLNNARKFILEMVKQLLRLQTEIQEIIKGRCEVEEFVQKHTKLLNDLEQQLGRLMSKILDKHPLTSLTINLSCQISSLKAVICRYEFEIDKMDDKIENLKIEYGVIQDVSSKFAYILVQNSITPFNRFTEPYLDLLIGEEMDKIRVNQNYPTDRLKSLKDIKDLHRESVEIIKKAIENDAQEETIMEDIYEYKENLVKLKFSGNQLEQMLETASWRMDREIENIPEKCFDLTQITIANDDSSSVTFSSNINSSNNINPKSYKETKKSTKNLKQTEIASIIQQLKVEFKEILIDGKSQQTASPITNMIYHLENARNVILNSNSQATFGDVTMTEQTIQNNCTDDVKSLRATVKELKKFCAEFSSTLDVVKIEQTVVSLESAVVDSETIQDSTNSVSTTEFSEGHSEVVVENSIATLPNIEESIDSFYKLGGIIVILLVIGLSILWNYSSLGVL